MDNHLSPRHVRHRKRSRLRRSKDFRAFLSKIQGVLNATGTAIASWTATAPVTGVAASGVLTASAIANADTITVGSKVYTFQDTLTNVANNVKRSGVLATDLASLAAAINGAAGAGTLYAALTVASTEVTAVAGATTLTATAKATGTAGNALASTETSATAAWAATTLLGGVTAVAASPNLAKTAHGLHLGDGPFLLTNSGGALPAPLVTARLYWVVKVPDANTFCLSSDDDGAAVVLTGAGTGTNTMTRASSLDAIFELLKEHGAAAMKAATDVDTL